MMELALRRSIDVSNIPPKKLIFFRDGVSEGVATVFFRDGVSEGVATVFFRDGVSEGEYNTVATAELEAIQGILMFIFLCSMF